MKPNASGAPVGTADSATASRFVTGSRVERGFCPSCEVALQLHDTTDGEGEFDCHIAGRKADLLRAMRLR